MMLRDVISRIRRNHAIEHATVSLLMARGIKPPLGGYSTAGGFLIIGGVTLEEVSEATLEALGRLKGGESGLAVSPFCGTNLVTGALLAGAAAALVMGNSKGKTAPEAAFRRNGRCHSDDAGAAHRERTPASLHHIVGRPRSRDRWGAASLRGTPQSPPGEYPHGAGLGPLPFPPSFGIR